MKLSSFSDKFVHDYKDWLKKASDSDLLAEKAKLEARNALPFEKHWKDADEEALSYVVEEIDARKLSGA